MTADYRGPERRTVITFTREDSDRLVRLESQLKSSDAKMDTLLSAINETKSNVVSERTRIDKLENRQSWIMGIGAAVTFIISSVLAALLVIGKH